MIIHQVAFRYSRALFQLADSDKELESLLNELKAIVDALNHSPQLMQFFSFPKISQKEKEELLKRSLGHLCSPKALQYLIFLLDKRRFKFLPEIVIEYERLVKTKLGILEVRLITATPLDAATKEKLKQKLERVSQKTIHIKEEVDPQLLGGGMLFIGNQMIDFSIRGKLNKMKSELLSTSN